MMHPPFKLTEPKLNTFLVRDELTKIELEDVYVVPRLLMKRPLQKQKEGRLEKIADPDGKTKNRECFIENHIELTIKEALTTKNHIIILGNPGAGKTSLLQYIALKISTSAGESLGIGKRMLPVLIPLREYQYKKNFKDFIFDYLKEKIYSLSEDSFHYLLETNSFFFLLDGLDELDSESERAHTSRQVEQFMAQYPRTRIVLTSQITMHRYLLMGVPCFTLAEFNDDEIEEFLVKWFTFLKLQCHKDEAGKADFINIMLSKEKILNLARNPLLLTMLLLIYRAEKNLPERRADIYEGAVKTVLETWKGQHPGRNIPDLEVLLAILEKVAFNLHSENKNTVKVKVVRTWLKEIIDELGSSSRKIDNIIQMLNEGLLFAEKDTELYGFVHQSLQEYFTARYIACEKRIQLTQSLIQHNMYSSHWREVFLLASSIAPPPYADLIFDSIINAENDFEEYIHSNVLFAGEALVDQPMLNPSKRNDIINQLKRLTSPDYINLLRIEAIQTLMKIRKVFQFEDMWALTLLDDEDWYIRYLALEYLTTVKADNTDIKEEIFGLLKDEDFTVRRKALEYYITVKADVNIKKRFFELLEDEDLNLRYLALEYFTSPGADDINIKKKFFELLENSSTCNLAIEYFTTTGAFDKEIKEKFFELLRKKDQYPPYRALRYFTTIGTEDTEITKKFIELLKDENSTVRKQAVEYFTTRGDNTPEVKEKIFDLLKDRNFNVLKQAVEYFTTVHSRNTEITEKFFKLLSDDHSYVRELAVRYFTALRDGSTEVKIKILELLKDEDLNVRYFAVEYLATVRPEDTEIAKKFFELLHNEDWRIRYVAVEFFTALKTHTTEIKGKIFELLKDVDPDVRYRAVRYFTIVRLYDRDIKEEISNLLKDEYSVVRYRALEYLTTLEADEEILRILLPLLKDEDPDVRSMTVEYLTRMKTGTDIKKIFFELLRDENPDVFELVMGYFITLRADINVKWKFLELLSDEDTNVRYRALPYLTIKGQENIETEKIFELLSDESCSLFPTTQIQDFAVGYLSRYAREESIKKMPILFTSKDESTRRGAYKLMKTLFIQ